MRPIHSLMLWKTLCSLVWGVPFCFDFYDKLHFMKLITNGLSVIHKQANGANTLWLWMISSHHHPNNITILPLWDYNTIQSCIHVNFPFGCVLGCNKRGCFSYAFSVVNIVSIRQSLTQPLAYFINLLTHSLTHSVSFSYSLTHSLTQSLTNSPTHWRALMRRCRSMKDEKTVMVLYSQFKYHLEKGRLVYWAPIKE